MKLLKYEKLDKDTVVGIVFDDETYGLVRILDSTRPREEILKDAYIILKNSDRLDYEGDVSTLEDLVLPTSKPTFMTVDFYNFTGHVYDQYGDEIFKDIAFEVVGTNKAKIENKKLIEEEVTEETSFFIVAKCGNLEEKQERKLYPRPEEPTPKPDMTATLVKEVANLKIDAIKDKQINKKLGQEVANLKIKLMKLEGGKN
ncbi:hypothetical protein [Peptoniphilus duerdenii]|uniref:hypothetical protein n=1 Tax=Peptoniphilus duerdenii TaxID=507750 RepID=UPI0023F2C7A8|nr:hypothetical protein [Peptoniphilus duerdenii]